MTFQEIRIIATGPCIANQLRDVNTIVKTIESTAVNYFESNNILGELQGAFRKVRRLEDHIFTLHGICSLAKSSKKPLYIAFLDLSKTFDRVWREGLLAKLWESVIQGKPWRLIKEIYRNVQKKDLFKDYESDYFDQEYGVKQIVFCPQPFSRC